MLWPSQKSLSTVYPEYTEDGTLPFPKLWDIVKNKWECTRYLFAQAVLEFPTLCPNCGSGVGYKKDPYTQEVLFKKGVAEKGASDYKTCFTYRCKNRKCSLQKSIFNGTFFENGKKPAHEVLMCLHLWLEEKHHKSAMDLLDWSERAVLDYYAKFRLLVSRDITNFVLQDINPEYFTCDKVQIGGPGIEVQIDESAFGKRKHNRGHHVDTKWVFGGVEIVPDAYVKKRGGEFFAVVVEDRKINTLDVLIKKIKVISVSICTVSAD